MNQHAPDKHRGTIIYLLLIAVTLAAFWQVRDHEFVHYDDDKYVMENPHVQTGLTRESIKWAFTTTRASNWAKPKGTPRIQPAVSRSKYRLAVSCPQTHDGSFMEERFCCSPICDPSAPRGIGRMGGGT